MWAVKMTLVIEYEEVSTIEEEKPRRELTEQYIIADIEKVRGVRSVTWVSNDE